MCILENLFKNFIGLLYYLHIEFSTKVLYNDFSENLIPHQFFTTLIYYIYTPLNEPSVPLTAHYLLKQKLRTPALRILSEGSYQ